MSKQQKQQSYLQVNSYTTYHTLTHITYTSLQQGVLNLIMGPHGTWVLNKQTPNRQIWWSSPLSGPMRFEYDPAQQKWLNTRDKRELFSLLAEEVYRISGVDIRKREQN